MIRRFFEGIYRWMAISGLVMKDDEPLEIRDPNREWGPAVEGFALSAKALGRRVSVVIKNSGAGEVRATIPGWLFFYKLEISPAPALTNFGRQALDAKRDDRQSEVVLTPGRAIEAELPIDSLYELGKARYRVKVSCEVAGRKLISNDVMIGG